VGLFGTHIGRGSAYNDDGVSDQLQPRRPSDLGDFKDKWESRSAQRWERYFKGSRTPLTSFRTGRSKYWKHCLNPS